MQHGELVNDALRAQAKAFMLEFEAYVLEAQDQQETDKEAALSSAFAAFHVYDEAKKLKAYVARERITVDERFTADMAKSAANDARRFVKEALARSNEADNEDIRDKWIEVLYAHETAARAFEDAERKLKNTKSRPRLVQ